jgi:hypothetical protein
MSATKEDMFDNALIASYSELYHSPIATVDYAEAFEFYEIDASFRTKVDKRYKEIIKLAAHASKK